MQIQPIQTQVQDYFVQLGPKKITAIALSVLGAVSLAASAFLAPIATPLTSALLIAGAAIFVTGFFLNFFTKENNPHSFAKGFWSNEGKELDIVLNFGGKPLDMTASLNSEHKIVVTWNDTQEKIIDFNEIPSMIDLIDNGTNYVYEKISPAEWLKQFASVEVKGFSKKGDTTRVQFAFN
ncbi:MAG: hypothetical protein ACK4HV_00610 [Parachlamydiaceae bacterium]